MKKCYIFLFSLLLCILQLSAENKSGNINGSETWSGSITLTGDIYVNDDDVLTIEPGTVIKSNAHYDFRVTGTGRIIALDHRSMTGRSISDKYRQINDALCFIYSQKYRLIV